ncbi:hypothetical protein D9M69_167090 [compost metagenome]
MKRVASSREKRSAPGLISSSWPRARRRPRPMSGVVREVTTSTPQAGMNSSRRWMKLSSEGLCSTSNSSRKMANGASSRLIRSSSSRPRSCWSMVVGTGSAAPPVASRDRPASRWVMKRDRSLSAESTFSHSVLRPLAWQRWWNCCIRVVLPKPAAARIRIRRLPSSRDICSSRSSRSRWLPRVAGTASLPGWMRQVTGAPTSTECGLGRNSPVSAGITPWKRSGLRGMETPLASHRYVGHAGVHLVLVGGSILPR